MRFIAYKDEGSNPSSPGIKKTSKLSQKRIESRFFHIFFYLKNCIIYKKLQHNQDFLSTDYPRDVMNL